MTNKYKSVEEASAWKKAHKLTLLIHKIPSSEIYGLKNYD